MYKPQRFFFFASLKDTGKEEKSTILHQSKKKEEKKKVCACVSLGRSNRIFPKRCPQTDVEIQDSNNYSKFETPPDTREWGGATLV